MRKHWKLLALALLLIAVMVGMGQSQADADPGTHVSIESVTSVDHPFPPADHFNALSAWTCGATRPDASYYLQYSQPYYFDIYHIRYTCIGHRHSPNVLCAWNSIYWDPEITGPYYPTSNSCTAF